MRRFRARWRRLKPSERESSPVRTPTSFLESVFLSDPTSRHDPTLTPLSRPFHPLNTGEELGWLDSVRDAVTTNLRPTDTAPTSPRSARSPRKVGTIPWDGGAIVRELVRHVTRTRLAMPRPGHDPKSTAPEPFPVLPLGSTLCSVAELRAMGPCASDLTRLWARSRRSDSDDEEDGDDVEGANESKKKGADGEVRRPNRRHAVLKKLKL